MGSHDKIAKTVPQIERGKLWCTTCARPIEHQTPLRPGRRERCRVLE